MSKRLRDDHLVPVTKSLEPKLKKMQVERKSAYVPKQYANPGIPYAVSQPKRFWRIKKGLSNDVYWKKRYWRRRITGRGSYKMNPSDTFGRRWGGYLGSKAGEFIGGKAQSIMGLGDYTVRKNVLSGNLPVMTNPVSSTGNTIRFQEYLGDIITGGINEFNIDSYLINSANSKTFPWLSQIAANYEQYELEGMVFAFKSTSADALNSTNTALGSVMLATQYDVNDPVFQGKSAMLNYEYSTNCKPSDSVMHLIECDPRQTSVNLLYTLASGQSMPNNADSRLYHLGRFSIATTGFQAANVNIGQLHVTYQVRLLKPKLFDTLGNNIRSAVWQLPINSGVASATPFGNTAQTLQNSLGAGLDPTTVYFPLTLTAQSHWIMNIIWSGANDATAFGEYTITPTGTAGATISPYNRGVPIVAIVGADRVMQTFAVKIPGSASQTTLVLSAGNIGITTLTATGIVTLTQVSEGFYDSLV